MEFIFFLGGNPQLAQKEIAAVATILPFPWSITILSQSLVQLKLESKNEDLRYSFIWQMQQRLGGTIRIIGLNQNTFQSLRELEKEILAFIIKESTKDKIDFGISLFDSISELKSLDRLAFSIKKRLKVQGVSARVVQTKEGHVLSSAQVIHNNLARKKTDGGAWQNRGLEIDIFKDPLGYRFGQTITVQNINSYAHRDFDIPVANSSSGMLPPKLAQMMLNIALAGQDKNSVRVYDPFCGNGRIVEEALLMGYLAFGSDLEPEKVKASMVNTRWIIQEYFEQLKDLNVLNNLSPEKIFWQEDATQESVKFLDCFNFEVKDKPSLVLVTEPYLGEPRRRAMNSEEGELWVKELEKLYSHFFLNWSKRRDILQKMVIIFPKAVLQQGELSLYQRMVDSLSDLRYSSNVLATFGRSDALIYREIVEITFS
jgi:tRNA G10  N-methylase Trm11